MSVCLTVHQNKLAFAGVFDTSRKVWTIISRKFGIYIYIYTYVGAVLRQQCRSSWSFLKWNLTSTIIYKQQGYLAVVVQKALRFFWTEMEQLRTKYFWGIFVTVSNWIYIFCCLIIYTSFTVEEEGLYSPRPNPSKAATLLLRLPHIHLGMYYLCTVQYILNTGLVCAVFVYVNSSTYFLYYVYNTYMYLDTE